MGGKEVRRRRINQKKIGGVEGRRKKRGKVKKRSSRGDEWREKRSEREK
jgi:hypothetical protein